MALGQHNSSPAQAHLAEAKGVLWYLAGTLDLCLVFASTNPSLPTTVQPHTHACGLSDADWALDEKDRKSISGYCFYYLQCLVSWSARKQRTVSTSSTESEYYALSSTIKEAIWMQLFLSLSSLPHPKTLSILCDNQSMQSIANTDAISPHTKHIDVGYHFIREHIANKSFLTIWIPTLDMVVDIFTKPLLHTLFSHHCASLGLSSVTEHYSVSRYASWWGCVGFTYPLSTVRTLSLTVTLHVTSHYYIIIIQSLVLSSVVISWHWGMNFYLCFLSYYTHKYHSFSDLSCHRSNKDKVQHNLQGHISLVLSQLLKMRWQHQPLQVDPK